VHALDAHAAHPGPFTADDLLPSWSAPEPPCQAEARGRRAVMRRARSKTKRPSLLAELERRYRESPEILAHWRVVVFKRTLRGPTTRTGSRRRPGPRAGPVRPRRGGGRGAGAGSLTERQARFVALYLDGPHRGATRAAAAAGYAWPAKQGPRLLTFPAVAAVVREGREPQRREREAEFQRRLAERLAEERRRWRSVRRKRARRRRRRARSM
jgi:hypothetical protein